MGLIITRRPTESIRLNGNILITVRRSSSNRVSLDIEAPKDVKIMRTELEGGGQQKNAMVAMRGGKKKQAG